ncbi:uncharacterized protein LOC119585863 [Penaeus monodon]|uniref:uncharacterized protein LOC119585863 n=1 Tax=Penaeus monodon TaxID=6687 RepID=UPI0018A6FFE7|nr:uncharacterized protein LOC119585863 [Penaeus monodon]
MAVTVLLTAMALLSVVEAVPVPVPNTQEITLQVPSELLKEHTLVLTLSPLPSTGKSLGNGEGSGAAASTGGSSDEGPTLQGGEATALTTMKPNATTSANGTTSETPSDILKTTVAPTVVLKPPVGGDADVPELILQFPKHSVCPEGHAPDMNGKCRLLFKPSLPAAKSLDNSVVPELLSQAVHSQE